LPVGAAHRQGGNAKTGTVVFSLKDAIDAELFELAEQRASLHVEPKTWRTYLLAVKAGRPHKDVAAELTVDEEVAVNEHCVAMRFHRAREAIRVEFDKLK
jgi:hypothetical protein